MKNKLKPLHFISTIFLSLTIALFLIPLTGINTYAATPSKTTNTAALNSFQLNHDVVTIAPQSTAAARSQEKETAFPLYMPMLRDIKEHIVLYWSKLPFRLYALTKPLFR